MQWTFDNFQLKDSNQLKLVFLQQNRQTYFCKFGHEWSDMFWTRVVGHDSEWTDWVQGWESVSVEGIQKFNRKGHYLTESNIN